MNMKEPRIYIYMGVSKNNGTPKSSILIGFSIINHPFWGTIIFGNTHIYIYIHLIWEPFRSDLKDVLTYHIYALIALKSFLFGLGICKQMIKMTPPPQSTRIFWENHQIIRTKPECLVHLGIIPGYTKLPFGIFGIARPNPH